MENIEEFKNNVDELHTLVHDTNVSYGVFYGKLDRLMRSMAMQYWGNIPTPIAFPQKDNTVPDL